MHRYCESPGEYVLRQANMKARSVDRVFAIVMAHLEADAVVSKVLTEQTAGVRCSESVRYATMAPSLPFDAQSTWLDQRMG